MAKELWKGNEAIAEAAVRAGLEAYFGYPITPQTELLEYLSKRMPELGRAFVQAESEVASINMLYGAACAGARGMTSTSSPGFSLMQEGLSYIAASNVPCVVVNMMRGGPGLGNILPTQGDYFQLTKGGGHGDYHPIVLAPSTVQEAVDLTYGAFDLAEKYRTIVIIAGDGNVGQMMEPVTMPPHLNRAPADRGWELTGARDRPRRIIESIRLEAAALNALNAEIHSKESLISANEARWAEQQTDDADVLVVAFGTSARIAQSAIRDARSRGLRAGLFRPITLWPFPAERLAALSRRIRQILVVEMNAGQMLEDVRLANDGRASIEFFGRTGGLVPMPDEILERIESIAPHMRSAGVWISGDHRTIAEDTNDFYAAA
jgi:2-oxoglutarate/2-oxoacid ferredoxin oxidoreductase subunit alpha